MEWQNDKWWTGKYLEVYNYFLIEVLSKHFPGGTDEYHKNISQNSPYPGWDFNPTAEYKPKVLLQQPTQVLHF